MMEMIPTEIHVDDGTEIVIPELPSIEVTKTFTTNDLNGNGRIDIGDRINYTITVSNTGNQDLTGLNLTEDFTNLTTDTLHLIYWSHLF